MGKSQYFNILVNYKVLTITVFFRVNIGKGPHGAYFLMIAAQFCTVAVKNSQLRHNYVATWPQWNTGHFPIIRLPCIKACGETNTFKICECSHILLILLQWKKKENRYITILCFPKLSSGDALRGHFVTKSIICIYDLIVKILDTEIWTKLYPRFV